MQEQLRELILADNAMWVGDFEHAFDLYNRILESKKPLDILSFYRANFQLAVVSTILEKTEKSSECLDRLEDIFTNVEENYRRIAETLERSIEEMQSSTIRQFLKSKRFDRGKIDSMLKEYFPHEKDVLALFISPRYARISLRATIRNLKNIKLPHIFQEGIFRFSLSSELYRVVGRAYSTRDLSLETLQLQEPIKVLIQNANIYHVEDENLRIIAGIQREGLVLCHYLLQSSKDTEGSSNIRAFLRDLSSIFSV